MSGSAFRDGAAISMSQAIPIGNPGAIDIDTLLFT